MLERGAPLAARWAAIPDDLDLLVTHGPPYGHGDQAVPLGGVEGARRAVGCAELLQAVRRARPRVHVFGHIHEGHGVTLSDEARGTRFVNAATCTVDYRPTNRPVVVDL
jgi:Icc-related predicted phosphoesterase